MGELHPIDVHVGRRLRVGRLSRGMSQSAFALHVGLTLQQVQKYEIGTHRISASALRAFGHLLGIQPNWFYKGLGGLNPDDVAFANDCSPATTERVEISLSVRDLAAEEHAVVQTLVSRLGSKPKTEFH